MKSVMQEASSVTKAIEQAWLRAGKPAEFTVKILEEPKKNFIGMTVHSAKIAFFFTETVQEQVTHRQKKHPENQPVRQHKQLRDRVDHRERVEQPEQKRRPQQHAAPVAPKEQRPIQHQVKKDFVPEHEGHETVVWSDEMIKSATEWLQKSLAALERSDITFTSDAQKYHLKFTFNKPIYPDEERERQLLRNFAFLMLQGLRNEYKRPLRGFKVILARAA